MIARRSVSDCSSPELRVDHIELVGFIFQSPFERFVIVFQLHVRAVQQHQRNGKEYDRRYLQKGFRDSRFHFANWRILYEGEHRIAARIICVSCLRFRSYLTNKERQQRVTKNRGGWAYSPDVASKCRISSPTSSSTTTAWPTSSWKRQCHLIH